MEGDGMVAIVQGLKDAGLAVTLMNKTHLKNSLKTNTVPVSKSSVETSTNVERLSRNTAAQVRDDHYTSSYQLAHCNIRPSSPPERLPEFPPQRFDPSRNQGNFQVGGYGSGEFFSPVPSYYGGQSYREMRWPDRGSPVSGRLSPSSLLQSTDPFVHSLRRYPISPERSMSSELVQRLLHYTQNKHSTKNAKSIRLRDESPTRDQNTDAVMNKNIQTYTRSKNEPTRDCGANTKNDIRFSFAKKGRSFASTSPYNVRSNCDRHNDTYNYLNTSSRRQRHHEVRYLNDVKKCIKDTIKQMYDDKPLCLDAQCDERQGARYVSSKAGQYRSQIADSLDTEQTSMRIKPTDFGAEGRASQTQTVCPKQLCCHCHKSVLSNQELTPTPEVQPELHEAREVTTSNSVVCTCKTDTNKSGNKIADEVVKWVKTVPVYADDSSENKSKREEMIQDLSDKLKSLEGDRNYEQKVKEEIMRCMEKLPIWYPGAKRDKEMFKNQMANDLFNRLTGIEVTNQLKDVISEWLDGIQFESDEIVDKDDIAENLAYRLNALVDKPNEIMSEIKDTLEHLPIVSKNTIIDKLVDKLTNDLTDVSKKKIKDKRLCSDSIDEQLEEQITDWLEDIPELSSDTKENKMMIKSLVKKLKSIQKQGLDNEETQEQMKEEVVDWIDSILKSKGEKLDSKTKAKITNKLLDKVKAATLESKYPEKKSSLGQQNDYVDEILEWLDNVLDMSKDDKTRNRKLVDGFARNVQELKSANADDEVINEEIFDFLGNLSKQGITVSSKNKDELANTLMNKIVSVPKLNKSVSHDDDLQQSILSEISELVDDIPSYISKTKRKEIKNKIGDILAKNVKSLSAKTDNINSEIVSILKKNANMPDSDASELACALINRVKRMTFPDQLKFFRSRLFAKTDTEIKELVSEAVSDVLNNYTMSPKKRNEAEKGVTRELIDQIVRSTDYKIVKNNIISILEDANISEDDALDISNRLLERNKELSLSYKTQDSKLGISKFRLSKNQSQSESPLQKEDFEGKAVREILNFIEDLTNDYNPKTREKNKELAEKLVHRVGEIVSDPNERDKEKSILEEVSQYLKKFPIDSDVPRNEMARTLANRIQGIGFQASTPKKDLFYPKRGSIDISSIGIDIPHDDSSKIFKKSVQFISNEEKQYVAELIGIIQTWMDELSIDLSATEDKGFKETMIQDLASDIIDRQKYLQLNPDAKTSNQEEVEHLKYQVFRWLNKLLDTDDLSSVMQKTENLMRKIKDVDVPALVKPTGKRNESKSVNNLIQDSMDSIRDEISSWMDEIPQNLCTSTDRNFQKQMINELAKKIQQFRANNQTENIDSEISNWLSKLLKDFDKQELTKMAEALKARLKERGFTEASFMLSQDSSEFLEENLIGGIQEWLQNMPFYQQRNSTEKLEITNLIPELVKGLKAVYTSTQDSVIDSDTIFIDEIVKHLKMFPMNAEQISDPGFLQKTAVLLMQYLKDLHMFANISERLDGPPDENLTAGLSDWFNSLPISGMNSTETKQFENLKKEFAEKIKQIRKEKPANKQALKDVIQNYLIKFPLAEEMKTNQKFINDKIERLLKNFLVLPTETVLEHGSDKFVKKAVAKWIELLQLVEGKTVDDISTNAIDELATAISILLVNTDVIEINNVKKNLEDEIEKFLRSVPLDPSATIDVRVLAEKLFKDVKEMSRRRSFSATPHPIKKAADILFDNIESWCEKLPLKGDTPEAIEKEKKVKQEIASKLIHKIGELNMNPEVFNDDFLYDDMLEDEIDNLLTDLSSEDIKNNLPALKKDLMEKVKEARLKTQEEVAGQAYKQQLREAISKTLPSQPLTVEEQVSFEALKDNLADAFINLHYVGGDEGLKYKYKAKINDEVGKFCNDYLKKHPASPIDSKKLNQDLYNALKDVPIPKEETIRNEVELVKIKDEVNDWVKELPLKEQTAAQQMQTNKMIAVLAKKIHDFEKNKELKPDTNYDDKMKKEITKWINKLPVKIDDAQVATLTDKLVDKLKSTEKSRRVSASTIYSIDSDTFDDIPSPKKQQNACLSTCTASCKSQYAVPPSTLSFEEREHLQSIKERCPLLRMTYPSSKDASVSPLPMDVGSQTEIRPWESFLPCEQRIDKQNSGVQTQRPPQQKTMQAVGSQAEVSPHIIVKEYYWDPSDVSRIPSPSMTPRMSERPSQEPCPVSQGPCSQCPHISPRSSFPCDLQSPTPQPRRPRKEWEQPCFRRDPGGPSERPEPGTSRSFRTPRARVTRLGSFDDMNPKGSRSRHEWTKFPEEDEFWREAPRFVSDEDDEPFMKERKKEEENVRCRCREKVITKCVGRKRGRGCHSTCQSTEDMKRCSKCCGVHCPYPSYLYFRQ